MAKDKELLELVKKAFEAECSEVFTYLREAELFKKKIINGERLAAKFEKFSKMELKHADILRGKLESLNEKVVCNFGEMNREVSLRKILKAHMERETMLYKMYGEIISLNDNLDFELMLKGMREDEKEHLDTVIDFLKKLKV